MKRGKGGDYGMGLARSTSFGRKRVALPNARLNFGDVNDDDDCVFSGKRHCFQPMKIEDLPQEILIRIVCGVEHDDLKSLFCVSKTIREAAVVAKQSHFAFSTPRKTLIFHEFDNYLMNEEIEAPNAPKQSRVQRSRLSAKKLGDLSVNLFGSDDDEVDWPR